MRTSGRSNPLSAPYVYMETLENAKEQRKEPCKAGSAQMGGT